ncbi:gypsy retrotransposon integrase 1-like protein, partial [Clarias magur]
MVKKPDHILDKTQFSTSLVRIRTKQKMAGRSAPTGSKRTRDPSVQGLNVKFLINIPVKVDSVDQAQKTCAYLLNALSGGFTEEDMKHMKENVAVIFGLNGKHSQQLDQDLKKFKTFNHDCKPVQIRHQVITYTWGKGGTIAPKATTPPYQEIREYLKNHSDTVELVKWLRGGDQTCLVYFSFVDSDTFKFNSIYSEYLQIVRDEKDSIPPTVMSTGYEFTHDSVHYIASRLDREVRVAVAEVEPLFVYFPEPNFCVLVENGLDTIKESFIDQERKDGKMESAVLIAQVKNRGNFKAVFPQKEPIIIIAPERFKLKDEGLITGQSHLDGMNLATAAYANRALTIQQAEIGVFGKFRGFIIKLYKCEDDQEFEKLSKTPPTDLEKEKGKKLVKAIGEARKYRKIVYELNE